MEILNYSDIDLAQTIKRSEEDVNKVLDIVSDILDNVKNNKDKAIREYTEKFDGVSIENLKVSEDVHIFHNDICGLILIKKIFNSHLSSPPLSVATSATLCLQTLFQLAIDLI